VKAGDELYGSITYRADTDSYDVYHKSLADNWDVTMNIPVQKVKGVSKNFTIAYFVYEKTAPCGDYPPDGVVTFTNITIQVRAWVGAAASLKPGERAARDCRGKLVPPLASALNDMASRARQRAKGQRPTHPVRAVGATCPPCTLTRAALLLATPPPRSSLRLLAVQYDGKNVTDAVKWTTAFVEDVCNNRAAIIDPRTIAITWDTKAADPDAALIAASQATGLGQRRRGGA
jgi:hypothetical protein